ncbi:unnamed protein product, partial [Didymodactylos carnosus]
FYDLKPNEELIELAKEIWQATADELRAKEQQEMLRQLIYLKRLPTKTDRIVNQLLHDNQISLSNPFLDSDQRASFVSRCSKTIIQCKFNLMMVQLDEMETVIRRHQLLLTSLQRKLSQLRSEEPHLYSNSLIDVIEERRQAMIQRFSGGEQQQQQLNKQHHCRSTIDIYSKISSLVPFIETELNLTPQQLSIFMNGLQYITPCQSRFSPKSIDEIVRIEFERISAPIKECLGKNQMSITDGRANQAFSELERIIYELYTKPLPPKLYRHAQREHKLVKHLQQLLQSRPDIIVLPIDK